MACQSADADTERIVPLRYKQLLSWLRNIYDRKDATYSVMKY